MTKAIGTRIAATVLLGLVLLLAPAALAGKGGNSGAGSTGSATLTLSPNPVPSWSAFWGSGCGYSTAAPVNIVVNSPYWNAGFPVGADANGCIAFQFWVDGPGVYAVKAMQSLKGNRQTVLGSASLTVT